MVETANSRKNKRNIESEKKNMICFENKNRKKATTTKNHLKNTINENDLHSVDVRGHIYCKDFTYTLDCVFSSLSRSLSILLTIHSQNTNNLNASNWRLSYFVHFIPHTIPTTIGNLMVLLNDLWFTSGCYGAKILYSTNF